MAFIQKAKSSAGNRAVTWMIIPGTLLEMRAALGFLSAG